MAAFQWNDTTGSWDIAGNWTPGSVPTAGDSVTIDESGILVDTSVAATNVTLDGTTAELDVGGDFITSGTTEPPGTLTLSGTLDEIAGGVVIDGTLKGGTVVVGPEGKGVGFVYGTLDGTSWDGELSMFATQNFVTVLNGLSLHGADGTGPGTLAITSNPGGMTFAGGGMLDNATIYLESDSAYLSGDTGTLTFGANADVFVLGSADLDGAGVLNQGSMQIGGFAPLGSVVGSSLIDVSGASLSINAPLINAGAITVDGGTVTLGGPVSGGGIDFAGTGGDIVIDDAADFAVAIGGLAIGDLIDLANVQATDEVMQGGTLTLTADGATVASLALTGIADGTAFSLTADGAGTDIALAELPMVTGIAVAPSSAGIGVGTVVTLTLSFNIAVTVAGGTPDLLLNNGGVAVYAGGSGSTALTFRYAVTAGQSTGSLAITGSALDGATLTDANGESASLAAAIGALPGPVQIEAAPPAGTTILESAGNVWLLQVGSHYVLANGSYTGPMLSYQGAPITVGQFGGAVPIAAEQVSGGYEVAWSLGNGQFAVWDTDTSGNYVACPTGAVAGDSPTLESLETTFGVDLNADGTVGPVGTALGQDVWRVGDGYMVGASLATAVVLQYQGSAVTVGQFGSGVAPIAAAPLTAGGWQVAWTLGGGLDAVWTTDTSGNYVACPTGAVAGDSPTLEALETSFGVDLNGDGTVGPAGTALGQEVWRVGDGYMVGASLATAVVLQYQGSAVTVGQFGSGVAPLAAAPLTAGGWQVAWTLGGGLDAVWNTDPSGNYLTSPTGAVATDSPTLEALETSFGVDLNGDGTVGAVGTALGQDVWRVGDGYMVGASLATAVVLQYQGSAVTVGQFGSGVAPIAAAPLTAGGWQVAWTLGGGLDAVWDTDASGNYLSTPTGAAAGTGAAIAAAELSFGTDLNGDGTIGPVGGNPTALGPDLWQVGNVYLVGTALAGSALLQYQGSAVTAGQFGSGVTPIAAAPLGGGGWQVAWTLGGGQYAVWDTGATANYLDSPTGAVSGTSFALEDLEPSFHDDLNGDGRLATQLVTAAGPGGVLDLSAQTQATTVDLGGNAAIAELTLTPTPPQLSFIGTPDAITLGAAPTTIEYAMGAGSGVETVAGFSFGVDELNIDLQGAGAATLAAYDVSVGGSQGVLVTSAGNHSQGVVLLNLPQGDTAANLLAQHTSFSGGHALVT